MTTAPLASSAPLPSPCGHSPACPGPQDPAHGAARTSYRCPEQGWSLLCNGVLLFDTGELVPGTGAVGPRRPGPHCPGPGAAV
ncbi:DUF5999 family protein [Streptomyces sp. NPDC015350]|uniref:DUF5999 family protein n=1 Tax=Streptomyces sp. NPDC015350 TaxID=3364955 RepID=UPI0036F724F5